MLVDVTQLLRFIDELCGEFEVFAPIQQGERFVLARVNPKDRISLPGCRTPEPLKALFYPPRAQLLPSEGILRKRLILGARNCDLAALDLLDRALLGEGGFVDPDYRCQRERTYLLAMDCTDPLPTCHCDLVGLKPYPESGYDLALSPAGTSYYLSTATAKGEEIAARLRLGIGMAEGSWPAEEIARVREAAMGRLRAQNAVYQGYLARDVRGRTGNWDESCGDCVECGACSYICPTCYCMVVNDETREPGGFRKLRTWDSCQHTGYARVAGGASPEPRLWQRFRHRYICKFKTMSDSFSRPGCTGCGRCITACPAGIDLREVINGL